MTDTGAVEWLVAGRERRSTAGNRLATLLHQEADAEDTLFLEDEDDVEFEGGEVDELSDLVMESSDEEDVAGGGVEGGEQGEGEALEGEKELQEQAKEERTAKKRKAKGDFLKPRGKKVTIVDGGDGGSGEAGAKPKKAERVSWIPEVTATRASSRTLSRQNRTETMKRLEESEKRRLHTIKLMEAAAAKKDKENPRREMTQAERLKEAELTEERNRKSLNKWEESEAVRLEEQRKKLAALQNRRLVGPVITWWSGTAEWNCEGKMVRIGKGLVEVAEHSGSDGGKKAKGKKRTKEKATEKAVKGEGAITTITITNEADQRKKGKEKKGEEERQGNLPSQIAPGGGKQPELAEVQQRLEEEKGSSSVSKLEPQPPPRLPPTATVPDKSHGSNIINAQSNYSSNEKLVPQAPSSPSQSLPPTPSQETISRDLGPIPSLLEGILDYAALPEPTPAQVPVQHEKEKHKSDGVTSSSSFAKPPVVTPGKKMEYSSRSLIVLENFDSAGIQSRDGLAKVLFPSEPKRSWQTHKPLCVITHQPAKFCDPTTGMPYASLHGYREIRRILEGEIQWSCLLGAYVGTKNVAAKGVPDGFP